MILSLIIKYSKLNVLSGGGEQQKLYCKANRVNQNFYEWTCFFYDYNPEQVYLH